MKVFLFSIFVLYCYAAPAANHVDKILNEEFIRSIYDKKVSEEIIPSIHLEGNSMVQYENVTMLGFSWSDCGASSDPVQVKTLSISPDPITIPGNEVVNLDATITSTIETATALKLVIKKKVFGYYITVPCVDNIGSCTYENPCEMLQNITCPPEVKAKGFTCKCPFAAKEYKLDNLSVKIPAIKLPSYVENGSYSIQATVMNGSEQIACYEVKASLQAS